MVEADFNKLIQVLINILANAGQAMGGEGHLDIESKLDESWVHLTVADSGPGLPEEDIAHIFDPFFYHQGTRARNGAGFGRQLVDRRIIWRAALEHSTGLLAAPNSRSACRLKRHMGVSMAIEKKKILVIDDEENIRLVLKSILQKEGYEVHEAGDGKAGLDKIDSDVYDLILCDVRMPTMDGAVLSGTG